MDRDFFWVALCTIVMVLAAIILTLWYSDAMCNSKWAGSGMKSDWGLMSGCRIEVKPGQWIPEERYREFAK